MVKLIDLIKSGQIQIGEHLEWIRPRYGIKHSAKVNANGSITTSDGVQHRTPSGAARHFYRKPIDGWVAWKVLRNGKSLSNIRDEFSY
jgi:hypothetical protein